MRAGIPNSGILLIYKLLTNHAPLRPAIHTCEAKMKEPLGNDTQHMLNHSLPEALQTNYRD